MSESASGGLRRTPLHALHLELGARMVAFAGYEMPLSYPGGILAEHRQCRGKAALFDVSHMGQAWLADDSDVAGALETQVCGDIAGPHPRRHALHHAARRRWRHGGRPHRDPPRRERKAGAGRQRLAQGNRLSTPCRAPCWPRPDRGGGRAGASGVAGAARGDGSGGALSGSGRTALHAVGAAGARRHRLHGRPFRLYGGGRLRDFDTGEPRGGRGAPTARPPRSGSRRARRARCPAPRSRAVPVGPGSRRDDIAGRGGGWNGRFPGVGGRRRISPARSVFCASSRKVRRAAASACAPQAGFRRAPGRRSSIAAGARWEK